MSYSRRQFLGTTAMTIAAAALLQALPPRPLRRGRGSTGSASTCRLGEFHPGPERRGPFRAGCRYRLPVRGLPGAAQLDGTGVPQAHLLPRGCPGTSDPAAPGRCAPPASTAATRTRASHRPPSVSGPSRWTAASSATPGWTTPATPRHLAPSHRRPLGTVRGVAARTPAGERRTSQPRPGRRHRPPSGSAGAEPLCPGRDRGYRHPWPGRRSPTPCHPVFGSWFPARGCGRDNGGWRYTPRPDGSTSVRPRRPAAGRRWTDCRNAGSTASPPTRPPSRARRNGSRTAAHALQLERCSYRCRLQVAAGDLARVHYGLPRACVRSDRRPFTAESHPGDTRVRSRDLYPVGARRPFGTRAGAPS